MKQKRREQKKLRKKLQQSDVYHIPPRPEQRNTTCSFASVDEEQSQRVQCTTGMIQHMHKYLPVVMKRLKKIPDPRNPRKLKHKLTMLMLYGILMFVFHMSSRREANREMTRPAFVESLKLFFPDLESLPHQDTLVRLLERIEVEEIEAAMVDLIYHLIRKKKFQKYLVDGCYPLAIDGTQKLSSQECWDDRWQERQQDGEVQRFYVYVVEASFSFQNGLVVPFMTEFLNPEEARGYEQGKQDCEMNAAKRLMDRIKKRFPRLPLMLLLDGLYANGPMVQFLRRKKWDFMIVLREKSLRSVWDEFNGLMLLEKKNYRINHWGRRRQRFKWINGIEYDFSVNNRTRTELVHVVVCDEEWQEIDQMGKPVTRKGCFAWISNKPLTQQTVVTRCNDGGRHRWGIEFEFLVEKHHGFHYEHAFAHSWNALCGYHYLLRLGLLFTVLITRSACFVSLVTELGRQGFIRFIRSTMGGNWFKGMEHMVRKQCAQPIRLSLI